MSPEQGAALSAHAAVLRGGRGKTRVFGCVRPRPVRVRTYFGDSAGESTSFDHVEERP